ncbi:MAG: MaoC family dehydratase [Nitrospirae bacterium]|nr:MaoC family dehydratase [Nitrospirota bacterium]
MQAGDVIPAVKKPPIERIQLVRYAGASGDFNPIHVDETFAKAAGYPSVFAHGMLTMGTLGQFLNQWLGDPRRLRKFSVRFSTIVWPGDVITCQGTVRKVDGGVATCDFQAVNQKGEAVVKGSAEVTI